MKIMSLGKAASLLDMSNKNLFRRLSSTSR
jgi:hypothetical protein